MHHLVESMHKAPFCDQQPSADISVSMANNRPSNPFLVRCSCNLSLEGTLQDALHQVLIWYIGQCMTNMRQQAVRYFVHALCLRHSS